MSKTDKEFATNASVSASLEGDSQKIFRLRKRHFRARCGILELKHGQVDTPVFMPVGTQGTLKGLIPQQMENALTLPSIGTAEKCRLILGNTYHLGLRPGQAKLRKFNGLHSFSTWKSNLLTDSGGFQLVSLKKLAKVSEEGVIFSSSHDSRELILSPEDSIEIQQAIGSDIMMQLDDVLHIKTPSYEEMEDSMLRSIRWLDRCIQQWHSSLYSSNNQNLFAIIQGGNNATLRLASIQAVLQRDCPGHAIGGLSGGEEKELFCDTVKLCTSLLPENKPIYLMGVGYPVDVVVAIALGVDMFDCVYPCRTARFGTALTAKGEIHFSKSLGTADNSKIDDFCDCLTCSRYTKLSMLYAFRCDRRTGGQLLSIHNMSYMMRLTRNAREAILAEKFDVFVAEFMINYFQSKENIPPWVLMTLKNAGIDLSEF
ncbi:hypothetical protein XU18_2808 [Perkinsela sp. CCAP 1560/4]|nr:hypothetical protein XU18_2808 [Perkinsela sp. CCAP 1560/4]|eukprot:KNH06303.1 hypothetical protein XU18_2808 [Perkinsela sp. CCAP 1560/4]